MILWKKNVQNGNGMRKLNKTNIKFINTHTHICTIEKKKLWHNKKKISKAFKHLISCDTNTKSSCTCHHRFNQKNKNKSEKNCLSLSCLYIYNIWSNTTNNKIKIYIKSTSFDYSFLVVCLFVCIVFTTTIHLCWFSINYMIFF